MSAAGTTAAAPSVLQDLEAPFVKLWQDIEAEAKKVGPELEALAVTEEQAAVATIEQVFDVGAPLAVAAVIQQAPLLISGQEKFSNAVTSVAQDLEAKLGPVAMGNVQTLVQNTYTGLQTIATANKLTNAASSAATH